MTNSEKTIIVVEDELIIALDLKNSLIKLGYKVLATVSSGEKAISYSETLSPDVVIMDVNLKGEINGIDAAKSIQKMGIPVIFLTAQNDELTLKNIKQLSCSVIIKPFNINKLKLIVEKAFDEKYLEKKSSI